MRAAPLAILSASCALLLGTCFHGAEAKADFTPATLLSGTSQTQFEEADSPAYSADGRYVVFRGSLGGVSGIYRRDLQSGEVVAVAVGGGEATSGEEGPSAPDAAAPSVSATGQYVAFTSAAVLDPEEDSGSGCPQVYVRDMAIPASQPGAYILVSAVNGSREGLTYAVSCASPSPSELTFAGSQAAPGVAISADGSRVVFTVLSQSNLTTAPEGKPETPARQVAVRDLETETTTLVSATPEGKPTEGGGAYPSIESEPIEGTPSSLNRPGDEPTASSAAISADGGTVAWEGTNVPQQVPSATDVTAGMASLGGPGKEVEPLWRRVADGPEAVTRRLLAGAGLNFYFVGATALEGSGDVLGGAFASDAEREFAPPALSANGNTVATIANAPTPAEEADYRNNPLRIERGEFPPPTDAYLLHVPIDPGAPIQTVALTATPSFSLLNVRYTGIHAVAISPDGSRVAFDTVRTSFAPPAPALVSQPVEEGNYAYTYEINLQLGTMQTVTSTFDGSPPLGEPQLLSFSEDDSSLALASSASNLFYGDGTPGVSQVYLTHEVQEGGSVAESLTGPIPSIEFPVPSWVLSATAHTKPDGSVVIDAAVPGEGHLAARAGAQLPTGKSQGRGNTVVTQRTVAQGAASATGPADLRLTLRAAARYRALVSAKKGLYCVLRLSFTAPGHRTLVREIPVTLRRVARTARKRRRPVKSRSLGARR